MIGYILTPDTSAKVFFLLQGVPNSGKSVLTTVISKLFSEDAVATLDIHSYGEKFAISELFGKSLAISPDLPAEALDSKAVGKIKQITGNDMISASVKYKSNLQFKCTAKIIIASNHPLLLKNSDDAFFERVVTIPFQYSVPKNEQSFTLIEELLMERDGIISKGINMYYGLRNNSYKFAGDYAANQVVMNGNSYCEDVMISIFNFVKRHFEYKQNSAVIIYDAYQKYLSEGGICAQNVFSYHFTKKCKEMFGVEKSRKRKCSGANAQSAISDLAWRNDCFI